MIIYPVPYISYSVVLMKFSWSFEIFANELMFKGPIQEIKILILLVIVLLSLVTVML